MFLNGNQTDNIITIRNLLEVKAAELAAESTNEAGIQKLRDVSRRLQTAYENQNYQEFLEDDLEFHICIAECSENTVIYSLIQTIRNLMKHVSGSGMVDEEQLREIYDEHQRVYARVIAKDAKGAAKAMQEHLDKSLLRYNYR